jgi:hypothetical protein
MTPPLPWDKEVDGCDRSRADVAVTPLSPQSQYRVDKPNHAQSSPHPDVGNLAAPIETVEGFGEDRVQPRRYLLAKRWQVDCG